MYSSISLYQPSSQNLFLPSISSSAQFIFLYRYEYYLTTYDSRHDRRDDDIRELGNHQFIHLRWHSGPIRKYCYYIARRTRREGSGLPVRFGILILKATNVLEKLRTSNTAAAISQKPQAVNRISSYTLIYYV